MFGYERFVLDYYRDDQESSGYYGHGFGLKEALEYEVGFPSQVLAVMRQLWSQ